MSFLLRRRWPIALDLGSHSIRMLQLRPAGQDVAVVAEAKWDYPCADGDVAQRRAQAVQAVRDMVRRGGFRGRRVVSALSCEQLRIKNIRLAPAPPDQLARAVQEEACERFDLDPTRDQFCWIEAGHVRSGSEMRAEVILLLAEGQVVTDHLQLLADMGLSPEHIDAVPTALARGMGRLLRRRSDEQAVSVVLDVGMAASRVVVSRGHQVVFIKSIPIGGRQLTEAVSRQLNLDYAEALELRRRVMQTAADREDHEADGVEAGRDSVAWSIHDAVRGEVESLGRELSLCLRYCSVTFRGLRPQRITITGGEAYDPTLVALLNEQINIECLPGEPLRGIDTAHASFDTDRRAALSEWAVCAGLALHAADLASCSLEADHVDHRLSA